MRNVRIQCAFRNLAACRRALGLAAALAWAVAGPSAAAPLAVNSAGALGDASPGDGVCATGSVVVLPGGAAPECTLRAAVDEANALPGPDRIVFHPDIQPNDGGAVRIQATTPLVVTGPVVIEGDGAPGYDPGDPDGVAAQIQLDGTFASGDGIVIVSTAAGSTLRGLAIHGFPGNGLRIDADDVTVQGCAFGLRANGAINGNDGHGILAEGGDATPARITIGQTFDAARGFVGEGNVVVASGGAGIALMGAGHRLAGNVVGANPSGTEGQIGGVPTRNLQGGIQLAGFGHAVGWSARDASGTLHVSGNLVSGNALVGIHLHGNGHIVEGNTVGTNASGTAALPNLGSGVYLYEAGSPVLRGNLISGNGGAGVKVFLTRDAVLESNRIGVSAGEDAALPNAAEGVSLSLSDQTRLRGNVVAGNGKQGVLVEGEQNELLGNWIGVTPIGLPLGNALAGIRIVDGTETAGRLNRIGGLGPDEGNVIGANGGAGVEIAGDSRANVLLGNWIGTDGEGADLGNGGHGVTLTSENVVGGAESGAANVIAHSGGDGIRAVGDANQIVGNFIGTDPAGRDLGNADDGIELSGNVLTLAGANRNVVGSSHATPADEIRARGNAIAFNGNRGIELAADNFRPPFGGVRQNALRGNDVYANGALGIDLHPFGATLNDPLDGDSGTNLLMNSPVVDAAASSYHAGTRRLHVRYRVDAGPSVVSYPLAVDFYRADAEGEGSIYLGSDSYPLEDATGWREVEFVVPAGLWIGAGALVATATDAALPGNTSEFSAPAAIVFHPAPRCGAGAEGGVALALVVALPLHFVRGRRRAA